LPVEDCGWPNDSSHFPAPELLSRDTAKSKDALARHLGQLILKPKQTAAGSVYEVSGDVSIVADNKTAGSDVMLVVARDGIGTPTAVESP
jgi:hypothetical protein